MKAPMKKKRLFQIEYLPLKVTLCALNKADLPRYLGSTLRGVIGQSLYRTDREAYDFLYANGKRIGEKQDVANPYMIAPPVARNEKNKFEKGEELEFKLLLWGEGKKYVRTLVSAMQDVDQYGLGAERVPFALTRIVNDGDQRLLWRNGNYFEMGENSIPIPHCEMINVSEAIVKLVTPLRIRRNGQLLEKITFQTLIRNITNRIRRITELYGGWMDEKEAERIQLLAAEVIAVQENLRMERLERYSNRLHEKMDFSGLLGEIEYEGNIDPFVPWLSAARILQIGRNTTFGMGKIETFFS